MRSSAAVSFLPSATARSFNTCRTACSSLPFGVALLRAGLPSTKEETATSASTSKVRFMRMLLIRGAPARTAGFGKDASLHVRCRSAPLASSPPGGRSRPGVLKLHFDQHGRLAAHAGPVVDGLGRGLVLFQRPRGVGAGLLFR